MTFPQVWSWPIVLGQTTGSSSNSLALLALRRWYSSLTLSSPAAAPSLFALWSWLLGLGGLLVLVLVVQGPGPALRQVFDIPGHVRLVSAAVDRLRRAGRMVAMIVGATVIAWTVGQTLRFNDVSGRDDMLLLVKARSLGELALEQGVMTALTPLRDLFGLGDNLLLLLVATAVLFRALTERPERPRRLFTEGRFVGSRARPEPSLARFARLAWAGTALYLLYRLGSRITGTGDLPWGNCVIVEVLAVPLLMAIADGVMLAWILVELRGAGPGDAGSDVLDPMGVAGLAPGASLACLLAMPARYLATAVLLLTRYHLPTAVATTAVGRVLRWQLTWGLADVQGLAFLAFGLAGGVAWSRGTMTSAVRGYVRLLAGSGGHLVVLAVWSSVVAGGAAALAYLLVLSLPVSTWVLAAADGYAHYATLPVGLLTLAALVELGERGVPKATLVGPSSAAASEPRLARDESVA